jgi:CubicO group peptidase (beta-lactamase class C family)
MILNRGTLDGAVILAPRTVDLMTVNHTGALRNLDGRGFGLGFETVDRFGAAGMLSQGAYGWGGAYATFYRVDPEESLTLVFMTQLLPNRTNIIQKFQTLVYQALTDAKP